MSGRGSGVGTKGRGMGMGRNMDTEANTVAVPGDGSFSRRSFIAGGALVSAAALAGWGIAGCSPTQNSGNGPEGSKASGEAGTAGSGATPPSGGDVLYELDPIGEPTETVQTDVVIIGGGGSGLSAAIQATQLGLKPLVLEKQGSPAGSYVCTEGILVLNNKYQAEVGISYDIDECIAEQMEFQHWLVRPAQIRAYYEQINETVDWMEEVGITFSTLLDMGKYKSRVLLWEHDPNSTMPGALVGAQLVAGAEKAGVEMMLQTPVKRILIEDGKAVGVLAEKPDGTVLKVEASAVISASGGVAGNFEMLEALGGFVATPFDVGMPGRDGDGLRMGLDAGAKPWTFPGTAIASGPLVMGSGWGSPAVVLCLNPLMWVNQDCERFIREDLINTNFAYLGNAAKMQKRLFVLFTQKDLDHFENVGPYSRVFSLGYEGRPLTGITEYLTQVKENAGTVFSAGTLDELANLANLDAAKLKFNVEHYNSLCAGGSDTDFGKSSTYLNPLEEGPYYALECADVLFGSLGSLSVTSSCECLDGEYKPIPGLYAVGGDAGGLFADTYDAELAPCSMAGWVINSGRLAAKAAAKYLNG